MKAIFSVIAIGWLFSLTVSHMLLCLCVSSDFVIVCWALWVASCRDAGFCHRLTGRGASCLRRRFHYELVTLNSYRLGVDVVCVGMKTAGGP